MRALFKSVNLIGDALLISPAWRQWIKENYKPLDVLVMQTLPNHVAPLYLGMIRDLDVTGLAAVFERPEGQFDFEHTFDVNAAFQVSDQKKQHLAHSYADLLGVKIGDTKESVKPTYIPLLPSKDGFDSDIGHDLRNCILVSMFSASCTSRDKNVKGLTPNKMVPFEKWMPMLVYLREKFPDVPIRALGAPEDQLPDAIIQLGIEPMFGIPLNRLALIMRSAKLLITIDNGMSHLGSSQETPTFLMYPRCLGAHYIVPVGNPNLVWVHMQPVDVKPEMLLNGLQYAVERFEKTVWKEKK